MTELANRATERAVAAAPFPACVPAYFHPDQDKDAWRRLLAVPPRMVVINPADGPGLTKDPAYLSPVARLLAAGTEVLGYVYTDFGLREVAEIRADMRRYRDWYGMRGVFLDQTAADEERLDHYREIVDGVRGAIVLNPGVYPDPRYAALADVLVTFDGPLAAYHAVSEPDWARPLARGRFCHLIHDVPSRELESTMRRAVRLAGLAHPTDHGGVKPWTTLPGYYGRPLATD